jgi:glycosyltransferase involved in cell wall biosynthesis
MKIAFVYDALYPFTKGGGEKRYYELAKRLASRHEVHLVSWQYWSSGPRLQGDGVWYHGVGRPKPFYGQDGRRTISEGVAFASQLLRSFPNERFDIIDCSSIPYFPTFSCRVIARSKHIPLVVTWHEFWDDYWLSYLGWRGHLARLVERASAHVADVPVAVSPFTARRLARTVLADRYLPVVPNGIDYALIEGIPPQGAESDIIFVGRLLKHKNVHTLVKAVRLLTHEFPRLHCIVVGEGPEREALMAYSRRLGLAENVTFTGYVADHDELFGLMKRSKVFVLPSRREGFGICVVEAQACGLPAVIVDAPDSAAPALIEEGETGVVCRDDAYSLASALARLLADPILLTTMTERTRALAAQQDWSDIAQRMELLYEQALRAKDRRGLPVQDLQANRAGQ